MTIMLAIAIAAAIEQRLKIRHLYPVKTGAKRVTTIIPRVATIARKPLIPTILNNVAETPSVIPARIITTIANTVVSQFTSTISLTTIFASLAMKTTISIAAIAMNCDTLTITLRTAFASIVPQLAGLTNRRHQSIRQPISLRCSPRIYSGLNWKRSARMAIPVNSSASMPIGGVPMMAV